MSLLSSIVKKLEDKTRRRKKLKIQQHEIQDSNRVFDRVFAARGTFGANFKRTGVRDMARICRFRSATRGGGGGGCDRWQTLAVKQWRWMWSVSQCHEARTSLSWLSDGDCQEPRCRLLCTADWTTNTIGKEEKEEEEEKRTERTINLRCEWWLGSYETKEWLQWSSEDRL